MPKQDVQSRQGRGSALHQRRRRRRLRDPLPPRLLHRLPPPLRPLVARRVPGAGPMPYERYGFALLPGYNGLTQASTLSDPPAGTQWQDQQAAGANDQTRSSRESDRFGIPGSQRATFVEAGPNAGQQP